MKAATRPAEPEASSDVTEGDGWLQDYLPYQLYRATHRLNGRLLSRLRTININASQWRVLSVLKSFGVLSLTGIKDEALMEQPTVSRVVAQLEEDGLVRRTASSDDLRITDVTLTPAGVAAFEQIIPGARRHAELALGGFTTEEVEQLRGLLKRIEANIDLYD